MYERSHGYRYDEAESGHAPDIAKLIRADIKQAVTEGLLPDRWSYSVRSDTYSMGQSIDITVKGCADAWEPCEGIKPGTRHVWPDGSSTATACPNPWCKAREDRPGAEFHDVLTAEADAAKMTLERIHGAYNHDGSEIQVDYFDVRYYGQVHFQTARDARFEQSEKDRKAARRAALDNATDRRTVKVYGRQGKRTTHLAAEIDGKLRLICGAVLWSGSLVGNAEGEAVTCSRCAKRLAS